MESLISIALGIGLAAAAGFRVFVPLFALSLASYFQVWPLNEQWQWLASPFALMILAAACIAEALAYLIPWFDNLLDTLAVPLAGVAGTAVMASTMADLNPAVTWALAIIGGGGAAAVIKGVNAGGRAVSTATTGGVANPIFSIWETVSAAFMSFLAIFFPVLAVIAVIILAFIMYKIWRSVQHFRAVGRPETTTL
ncbi:DUF4126 domain-containing protein [Vitreoscilla massiliensis]|uniref:DUF4126 domain-containing protein n=1 Tax=Vitreoscilla massiliensis TaxID=1689272 RepID=A0ABY4DX98_9NEIS|nr:DUF4126 domain-containing protein [Vitreoscilla massiliensis]UOO88149.1 DUF4126 domain-containing protein [Vitreoscilla massiliensis]